jgi:hypothetical protein
VILIPKVTPFDITVKKNKHTIMMTYGYYNYDEMMNLTDIKQQLYLRFDYLTRQLNKTYIVPVPKDDKLIALRKEIQKMLYLKRFDNDNNKVEVFEKELKRRLARIESGDFKSSNKGYNDSIVEAVKIELQSLLAHIVK